MKAFLDWCKRYVSLLFVIIFGLFVYVLFFHDNSYSQLTEYNNQISDLKEEIKENRDTLEYYRQLNNLLNASTEEMERIARERYHMQGPNEEVYIVK